MITKGADYNETQEYGTGNKRLPKGGYVCKIAKAEEIADKNGRPMIHIAFDVFEGEYKGHFLNLFQTRKANAKDKFKEVKWPFEGQSWIQTQDWEDPTKTSKKFKGFCTALEDSGTNVWAGNQFVLSALNGALVGVVFRDEEQEYEDKTYWRAIPMYFRSVNAIREEDYFLPDDKPLENKQQTADTSMQSDFEKFAEQEAADLPF